MEDKYSILIMWVTSLFGGLVIVGARLGWLLFRVAPDPPVEPEALAAWKMKRHWLIISEFSSLPAFATVAVVTGVTQQWSVMSMVLMSMVLGALGFAFFLDALQTVVRRRLGMDEKRD